MLEQLAKDPEGTIISKTPGGEPFSFGREVAIDPNSSLHLYLYTSNPRGWDPISLEGELAHEFGHRLGWQDSGVGRMDNTIRWEVPVERELGLYPRTQMGFAPWPGVPWAYPSKE